MKVDSAACKIYVAASCFIASWYHSYKV